MKFGQEVGRKFVVVANQVKLVKVWITTIVILVVFSSFELEIGTSCRNFVVVVDQVELVKVWITKIVILVVFSFFELETGTRSRTFVSVNLLIKLN